jgi:hypothetical protein
MSLCNECAILERVICDLANRQTLIARGHIELGIHKAADSGDDIIAAVLAEHEIQALLDGIFSTTDRASSCIIPTVAHGSNDGGACRYDLIAILALHDLITASVLTAKGVNNVTYKLLAGDMALACDHKMLSFKLVLAYRAVNDRVVPTVIITIGRDLVFTHGLGLLVSLALLDLLFSGELLPTDLAIGHLVVATVLGAADGNFILNNSFVANMYMYARLVILGLIVLGCVIGRLPAGA